ncbi:MAG: thiamine-phosphate kinase [Candidatus Omnitrophica bacterium CG07_land_8_20_14_0_80_42_15]|uniref:Thiamine-monophosphate kinase n=1 Tax=Candidatus Aquitaenariimonas noxiae TaxID=1974741 RepID=A0A2J0L490_9BACT|nr:MAG: thiamine-phosphate kinase [Candidatus Omnitrophica bacterium CG07_land_8_20_14_0_80_42_15]
MAKQLSDIGEFGLIKEIAKLVHTGKNVIKGIGDDAAVIKYKKDSYLLATTDMLIEGVHFKLSQASPYLIGRKAIAVNISDIAAMGGIPKYAVVALGMSSALKVSFAKELYKGMEELGKKFGVIIVGGDTNSSGRLIISVSLIGEVEKNHVVFRNGAKIGDSIFVTGSLGGTYTSKRHLEFTPRLREARYLVSNFRINSMIDISDGLASDLTQIAEASGVGAYVEEKLIPINKKCNIANALFDGEDFELLFTISENRVKALVKKWPYKIKLSKIGKIASDKGLVEFVGKGGDKENIYGKGFRHF